MKHPSDMAEKIGCLEMEVDDKIKRCLHLQKDRNFQWKHGRHLVA
jgi:hypothetical protein